MAEVKKLRSAWREELNELKVGFTSGGCNDARCFAGTRQKLIWLLSRDGASKGSMLYSLGIKYMADVHKCHMPKRVGNSYNIAYMNDLKTGTPVYFDVLKSGGWDMCMAAWKDEVVAWQKESPEVIWLVIEHTAANQ